MKKTLTDPAITAFPGNRHVSPVEVEEEALALRRELVRVSQRLRELIPLGSAPAYLSTTQLKGASSSIAAQPALLYALLTLAICSGLLSLHSPFSSLEHRTSQQHIQAAFSNILLLRLKQKLLSGEGMSPLPSS